MVVVLRTFSTQQNLCEIYSIIKKSNVKQNFLSFDTDCKNTSGHLSDILKSEKKMFPAFQLFGPCLYVTK